VEWELAEETEACLGNPPQYHFIHHKYHMTWLGSNPGRRGGKPATNRLRYGTNPVLDSHPDIPCCIIWDTDHRKITNEISATEFWMCFLYIPSAPYVQCNLLNVTTVKGIRHEIPGWKNTRKSRRIINNPAKIRICYIPNTIFIL
jgi:hypothetical protein